jgi:hypothetical protein
MAGDRRPSRTRRVTIDINGDMGGPLGNLVCTVLTTVNNVVGLVKSFNSLLVASRRGDPGC